MYVRNLRLMYDLFVVTKITQTFENGQTLYGSGDVPSKGHVVIDVNAGIA
jgi:hypothetical protein